MDNMNFHQTPEEIIKYATAEQRILWNYIFLEFGEKVGLSQLYYMGPLAGSEFLIYNAAKLYLGLSVIFGSHGTAQAPACIIEFFNRANASLGLYGISLPVWDTTAAALKYVAGTFECKSISFSRIVAVTYPTIIFHGYRLSI